MVLIAHLLTPPTPPEKMPVNRKMAGAGLLIALLSMVSAGPANAGWMPLTNSDDAVYLVNLETLRGGRVKQVWSMRAYGKPQKFGKRRFKSAKDFLEISCDDHEAKVLYSYGYSGNMGDGAIVFTQRGNDNSEPIVPDTIMDALANRICQ
jgi:hypothetical protein